ncbi:MAG TPA: tetratricopeptide repeat protein [Polyangia bacterium]|nr:tetratricopeptide repeat protein [Polyangia bacterium]
MNVLARALAVTLACAGCSGATLPGDYDLAQSRERARDDEGALALYQKAAADCARGVERPHDDCALALVRSAQLLDKLHRFAEAYRTWLEVPKHTSEPLKAARALQKAAVLATDELHDDAAAEKLAWACVERFPDEVPADDALDLAIRLGKRRDPSELALKLQSFFPAVERRELGDNVMYAIAELHRESGDGPGAVELYDRLAEKYPHSPLRDDSWWHAAEVLRAAGDAQGALRRLRRLLETRRDAIITGSYNSLYLDDAEMLMGHIYLDDLHDPAHACEAFQTLADDFKESILRDDALVELARAQLALDDKRAACKSLARLIRQYPNSNKLRQARALSAELACN